MSDITETYWNWGLNGSILGKWDFTTAQEALNDARAHGYTQAELYPASTVYSSAGLYNTTTGVRLSGGPGAFTGLSTNELAALHAAVAATSANRFATLADLGGGGAYPWCAAVPIDGSGGGAVAVDFSIYVAAMPAKGMIIAVGFVPSGGMGGDTGIFRTAAGGGGTALTTRLPSHMAADQTCNGTGVEVALGGSVYFRVGSSMNWKGTLYITFGPRP